MRSGVEGDSFRACSRMIVSDSNARRMEHGEARSSCRCWTGGCEAVLEKEADYLITVKGNQPLLLRDIEQAFVIPEGFSPLPSAANTRATANRHDH